MGNNFFTLWLNKPTPGYTVYGATDMNGPLQEIDKALTYLKNVMVMPGGPVLYDPSTGILSWDDTIEIIFNRADGDSIRNTIATNSLTLSDDEFAYVDLSETHGTALTMQKAALSLDASSNFISVNRLVLGIREADSNQFREVYLKGVETAVISQPGASSIAIDWTEGRFQKIDMDQDATLSMVGAKDGDRLLLRITQDEYGGWVMTWPGNIRYCIDIPNAVLSTAAGAVDYAGFIYDEDADVYDLVSFVRGMGITAS